MSDRIRCEVTRNCPHRAYAQAQISGVHADKRDPVNMCRTHSAVVLADFLSISNDIHVRKAV